MSVRDIADDRRETLKRELVLHKTESLKDILFLSSTQNVGEPFYFDANRAINAKAQDVGFSVDKLKKGSQKVTSMATPAVELLCLIGLQRARPLLALNERGKEREYEYHLWYSPLSLPLLAAAASGLLAEPTERYRFANPSRAKDYRAFAPAKRVS
jgi:CRISPR-associated protein Csb3